MALFRETNDKQYDLLLAENRFVSDIQLVIERALKAKEFSQVDLARALDISEARVSQILAGNGKNLQARTLARIAHVLGMRACLEFSRSRCEPVSSGSFADWIKVIQEKKPTIWENASNDDYESDMLDCRVA